ncbi:hypothetical protein NliqN6_4615 [Naganishia liquefaciens]|uniref:PIG-P domain-containing protein n=1 Tax=Naganishia liquefaciens TaxID=104408 RepID=A0A8H3TW68_9TREE|nr:hypothetical protein NliqN6_4615 [Naganishia liquefaciens]
MPSIMQLPDDDPPLPSYRATNGFLALCTTYALFALYLIWALLPSSILTAHPFLAWLPDQAWTTVVPSFLMVTVLATYGSYLGLMLYNTPPMNSLSLLVDQRSEVPPQRPPSSNAQMRTTTSSSYPNHEFQAIEDGPYDAPIGVINRRIFPPRRRTP